MYRQKIKTISIQIIIKIYKRNEKLTGICYSSIYVLSEIFDNCNCEMMTIPKHFNLLSLESN